jgi:hypothetical protein
MTRRFWNTLEGLTTLHELIRSALIDETLAGHGGAAIALCSWTASLQGTQLQRGRYGPEVTPASADEQLTPSLLDCAKGPTSQPTQNTGRGRVSLSL